MPDEKNENESNNEQRGSGENKSKKPNLRKPSSQSGIVSVIGTVIIVFAVFMILFSNSGNANQKTDELLTSDFTAAVAQERVTEVDYTPSGYSITG